MKPTLLALSLVLSFPAVAQEAPRPEPRTITVTGNAERVVPADRVRISVSLRSVREELAAARAASQEGLAAIVESLAQVGVPSDKVQLENHLLGREYEHGPDGHRFAKGFFSERQFTVELDDAALLELVHGSLAGQPDVSVNHTSFSRKDEIEIRKELRQSALEAAQEKAEAMAEVYGQQIGLPLRITEGGGFQPMPFNRANSFAAMAPETVGGSVSLEALVEVTFELTE